MAATKIGRKRRARRRSSTKLAIVGTAAATVAAVALGPVPSASALDVAQEVYTAGPLLNLLPALGLDTVTVPVGNFPGIGDVNLVLTFEPIAYDALNIYNTINALPFSQRLLGTTYDRVLSNSGSTAGQFPLVAGDTIGTRNLVDAYRTQISSVNGDTPSGYTPFQPGPGTPPAINQTNQVLTYVLNSLRPNGGIEARFAPILNRFGVDTTLPAAGLNSAAGITLNTGTLDVTWAYSPLADFPVTLNPFSLVNSAMATLPTNLLGGFELEGIADVNALGLSIASTLGIPARVSGFPLAPGTGQAFYATILGDDLPILEFMRLPARIINAIFGLDIPTPFADALQPAAKILVNIGYSDVLAPDELDDCATGCGGPNPQTWAELGYAAYDRTFLTAATPEPFLSVEPLTPEERRQVPGDVLVALFEGFKDVFCPDGEESEPDSAAPVVEASAVAQEISTAPTAVDDSSVADEPSTPQVEVEGPSDETAADLSDGAASDPSDDAAATEAETDDASSAAADTVNGSSAEESESDSGDTESTDGGDDSSDQSAGDSSTATADNGSAA